MAEDEVLNKVGKTVLAVLTKGKSRRNVAAQSKSGGGKNAQKSNQNRQDAAKERYEAVKKEYEELKAKPNKTKEDNKKLKKLEARVEHERKMMNEKSENHSIKEKK